MIRVLRNSFLAFTGLVLIMACGERALYDEAKALPQDGWDFRDTMDFSFVITDTSDIYNVYLHVRNEMQYSYSNLWIFVGTTAPNGATQRDTLELILADEAGRWLGKGTRSINTMLIPYMRNIKFPYLGIYSMGIQHAMRDTVLYHVHDIGVRIQPVK